MRPLTKKYVFERKLDGKPIIIYVDKGFGGWATKEDAKLLRSFGIIAPYKVEQSICTHEILTYALPFNPHDGPVSRTQKGEFLGRSRKPQ